MSELLFSLGFKPIKRGSNGRHNNGKYNRCTLRLRRRNSNGNDRYTTDADLIIPLNISNEICERYGDSVTILINKETFDLAIVESDGINKRKLSRYGSKGVKTYSSSISVRPLFDLYHSRFLTNDDMAIIEYNLFVYRNCFLLRREKTPEPIGRFNTRDYHLVNFNVVARNNGVPRSPQAKFGQCVIMGMDRGKKFHNIKFSMSQEVAELAEICCNTEKLFSVFIRETDGSIILANPNKHTGNTRSAYKASSSGRIYISLESARTIIHKVFGRHPVVVYSSPIFDDDEEYVIFSPSGKVMD